MAQRPVEVRLASRSRTHLHDLLGPAGEEVQGNREAGLREGFWGWSKEASPRPFPTTVHTNDAGFRISRNKLKLTLRMGCNERHRVPGSFASVRIVKPKPSRRPS